MANSINSIWGQCYNFRNSADVRGVRKEAKKIRGMACVCVDRYTSYLGRRVTNSDGGI